MYYEMERFSNANNLESDQMSEFSEEASNVDWASDCEVHIVCRRVHAMKTS